MIRESDLWAVACAILAVACVRTSGTGSALATAVLAAWMMRLFQEEERPTPPTEVRSAGAGAGAGAMLSASLPSPPPSPLGEAFRADESGVLRAALPPLTSTRGVQKGLTRDRESAIKLREALRREFFGSE